MAELTDAEARAAIVHALVSETGMAPVDAQAAVDHWQGDHDYRAWQRGYQEAMIFASNLLLDAADNSQRR